MGSYRVDAIAAEMFDAGMLPDVEAEIAHERKALDTNTWDFGDYAFEPYVVVREHIEKAATAALDEAYWQLVDRPAIDTETRQHLDEIQAALRVVARISAREPHNIANHLAKFRGVQEDTDLAYAQLRAIQISAQQFVEWSKRLFETFPYKSTPNTNRSVLSWHFIDEMAQQYQGLTKARPPASKTGLFVRLLAAAWLDVQFPPPIDSDGREREDLEGWLGTLVEKHPAILRKPRSK